MSGMVLADLEQALYTWVKSKTVGWTLIWSDQNAPKPGPKEITIRQGDPYITKIGQDVAGGVTAATGARKKLGTRELALEIRAFGLGATQIAEDIRTLLDDESAEDALIAGALAVISTGPVRSLASLYGKQYKEVASFELRLRTHSLREDADAETGVGYIQDVDLDAITQNPGAADSEENILVETPPG